MISTMDIAWAAGFLEGEGSFGSAGPRLDTPIIRAGQVQREPLERLQKMFGGSIYFSERSAKDSRRSDFYTWAIFSKRAASVGMTLYALLSPRRRSQCKDMLDRWRKLPGARVAEHNQHLQTHCPKGHEYTSENTKRVGRGRKYRACKVCHREQGRRYHAAKIAFKRNTEDLHKSQL